MDMEEIDILYYDAFVAGYLWNMHPNGQVNLAGYVPEEENWDDDLAPIPENNN